jgi:hypothetical protein
LIQQYYDHLYHPRGTLSRNNCHFSLFNQLSMTPIMTQINSYLTDVFISWVDWFSLWRLNCRLV